MKIFTLSLLFIASGLNAIAQKPSFEKQFKISVGIGYANSTMQDATGRAAAWLQTEYQPSKTFSIATEFENMGYYFPLYYKSWEPDFTKAVGVVNSFSFLAKYHFFTTTKSKLDISIASGITYAVVQKEDFITLFFEDNNETLWVPNISSDDHLRMPFLVEAEYPLYKTINLQGRIKYSYAPNKEGFYSAGLGLSIKFK